MTAQTTSPNTGTPDLGRYGVWINKNLITDTTAPVLERVGYGAVWIGGSPGGDLAVPERLLAATEHLVVATGIVNIWSDDPRTTAASYHRLAGTYPGRFLLGIGVGHPEQSQQYRTPYDALVGYLDALDAEGVPVSGRVLAALGPRVLRLSRDRTAGAHPYLTTPQHTREARELLGAGVLLAPEHKVVLEADPAAARAAGRPRVEKPYLGLRNYRASLQRLGWDEADLNDGGSDALIDALVAWGTPDAVAARLTEHLDAGADHVCAQVLTTPGHDRDEDHRVLAAALGLTPRG